MATGGTLWGYHKKWQHSPSAFHGIYNRIYMHSTRQFIFKSQTSISNRPRTCYPSVTGLMRTLDTTASTAATFSSIPPSSLILFCTGMIAKATTCWCPSNPHPLNPFLHKPILQLLISAFQYLFKVPRTCKEISYIIWYRLPDNQRKKPSRLSRQNASLCRQQTDYIKTEGVWKERRQPYKMFKTPKQTIGQQSWWFGLLDRMSRHLDR